MKTSFEVKTSFDGPPDGLGRRRSADSDGLRLDTATVLPGAVEWPSELSPGAQTAVAFVGCVVLAATLAFYALGARGLFSPAEARYALIARAMVESGDWIQPRLNHVRYDEKPPLLYWAIAASYRWFGESELTSRLPSALAYVGTCALTFAVAEELLGASAAPLAALVYATSIGTFLFGRFVFTDTLLVFCLTLSLYGLCRVARGRGGAAPAVAFHLGMALAGLTKGFVGLVFPAAAASTYAVCCAEPGFRKRLRLGLGAAILAVVFLPWHVAVTLRDPSFLGFYVVNEHIRRFFDTREPIDYVSLSVVGFWISTLFWLLPWTLFLPGALRSALARDRGRLAIPLLWSAWVVGFFSLSRARLEYYALPAVPSLAVIVAAYWQRLFEARWSRWEIQLPALVLLAAALAAVPKLFLFPSGGMDLLTALVSNVDGYYREYFSDHPGQSFALVRETLQLARPFTILLCLIGSGVGLLAAGARARLGFVLLVAGTVCGLGIVDLAMRLVAADRSQRELARIVEREWTEGSHLVVIGAYEDFCGISYYTRRPTEMLDASPQDLLFGYRKGDARGLFLTPESFQREWQSPAQVFVLSDRSVVLPAAVVLAEGPRDVLRTNHPLIPASTPSSR